MRIYLYQAFASNNSGSYTLVGTFKDEATAEEVARLLAEVSAAHSAWLERTGGVDDGPSPLDELVKREGLRGNKQGRNDDWPYYDDAPRVVAAGLQVLFHSTHTLTMPAALGELFYARGGRVQMELDHAHAEIAVEFDFWLPHGQFKDKDARREKLDAFEMRLEKELPAWTTRSEADPRPQIEPAWYHGEWGSRHVAVVFDDLVEGVQGVRTLARDMAVELRFKIWECPHGVPDPFTLLRGPTIEE
ncbi:hypothetical protein [Polyangium mundeleinium]|uniref:Uncharacterized protein n=1 Tax=Polyangium mundeleinium TaxID=2995306 RepID=A0ABT5EG50_9BACT|nr:hypothetical protein [Polyangium mundeleinium]MDC0740454.1 hypothetical protein [Polyangium mundeleinium]